MAYTKELGHENTWFSAGEGYAHYIVHEGEDRLYFGISSVAPGIGVNLIASLAPGDVDALIDLLRRGNELVKADIARRAPMPASEGEAQS